MKIIELHPPVDLNLTAVEYAGTKLSSRPRMILCSAACGYLRESFRDMEPQHWAGWIEWMTLPTGLIANDFVWALVGDGECVVSLCSA